MKVSLRVKGVTFIIAIMLLMGVASFFIGRKFIYDIISEQYYDKSAKISRSVASALDPEDVRVIRDEVLKVYESVDDPVTSDDWGSDEFNEYVSNYEYIYDFPEYKNIIDRIRPIQDINELDCVFVAYMDFDKKLSIYLADAAHENASPIGCIDFYPEAWEHTGTKEDVDQHGVTPYETRTEVYGWLVSAGYPVKDNDNETVGYAYVDVSMDTVAAKEGHYSRIMLIAISVCVLIGSVAGVLMLEITMIGPIRQLSEAASGYKLVRDEIGGLENNGFAKISISSGDEIQVLADSMKKMEKDLNEQVENLFATKQELMSTREHADIMSEMASRDALTGVKNKRGYETEIQRINKGIAMGNTKVGIVMVDMNDLKNVNDSFGHEKGDKVICSLCDMLCSVFKRSPVFRVGGDEFVVIVSNYDYANLESNVEKFLASVEHNVSEKELEPWERASAAIGYAKFDPDKDIAIEDTLKRADEHMYACKQEMKSKYNDIMETEGTK